MKPRVWKRWAVVSKTGLCMRNLIGAAAIYRMKAIAEADCAKGQYVVQVIVREVRRKK